MYCIELIKTKKVSYYVVEPRMNKIIGRTIITVTEPANAYKNLRKSLLVLTSHSVECYDTRL